MAVTIDLDFGQVLKRLSRIDRDIKPAARYARGEVGDELLRLSQKEVPHDEGTLANTGVSEREGDEQVVGYNTPYAARLHENPGYTFQKGRKGKYLEQPMKENIAPFRRIFLMAMLEKLGLSQ